MYTTGRYRVFGTEPGERRLARPRHLVQEGRLVEAAEAYRSAISARPEWRPAWLEYFQLLRSEGQFPEALELAKQATDRFPGDLVPWVLQGAALVELGRYREGLRFLEQAAAREPDLALVWHEAGYAAFRLGEHARALLALDRAFALEPHNGTLHLRGQVLREAGQYLAAEVAFDAAAEAAEFPEQRHAAEREIAITRRLAGLAARRPADLSCGQRWFADTGAVVLASAPGAGDASEDALLGSFTELAQAAKWRFTALATIDDWPGWPRLAQVLRVPAVPAAGGIPRGITLVVARRPPEADQWSRMLARIAASARGLSFVLEQPPQAAAADVAGRVLSGESCALDLAAALRMTGHPEGRLAGRSLA